MEPNIQQPVQTTPVVPSAQPTPPVQPNVAPAGSNPPKSNKKMLVALLIVIVLALLLGGLGYLYLQNNSTNNQAYVPPQPTSTPPSPTPEVRVNNATDLDTAVNEVNGITTTTMETEYNQALEESKNL